MQEVALQRTLLGGDRLGEETARGEAMGKPLLGGRPGVDPLRETPSDRDPDRPVEGARDVGAHDRGDLLARLDPTDLRQLHPGDPEGARGDRLASASVAVTMLSSPASGIRVRQARAAASAIVSHRLLDQLDAEWLDRREDPRRLVQRPRRVGVEPDLRLRAERRPHRLDLSDVVAGADLQLEGPEPGPRPARRLGGDLRRRAADQVALQRTGDCARPSSPCRFSRRSSASPRVDERAARGAREALGRGRHPDRSTPVPAPPSRSTRPPADSAAPLRRAPRPRPRP